MSGSIKVEICINCDGAQNVEHAVRAAYASGAATVELCSAMHCDGLTPSVEHIIAARRAFFDRPGLLAMIRPRSGDFSYSREERTAMQHQIEQAAAAGANGVAFGALQHSDRQLALDACRQLIQTSHSYKLQPSFQRAFDATADPLAALDQLIDLGVERILTSGIPWGHRGTAGDSIDRLNQIIERSAGKVEVVIGGGITPHNAAKILRQLTLHNGIISVHSFSGAQEDGATTEHAVKSLVDTVAGLR